MNRSSLTMASVLMVALIGGGAGGALAMGSAHQSPTAPPTVQMHQSAAEGDAAVTGPTTTPEPAAVAEQPASAPATAPVVVDNERMASTPKSTTSAPSDADRAQIAADHAEASATRAEKAADRTDPAPAVVAAAPEPQPAPKAEPKESTPVLSPVTEVACPPGTEKYTDGTGHVKCRTINDDPAPAPAAPPAADGAPVTKG